MVTDGVRPPWASLGVQLNAPVELLIVMPSASDAASSEYVRLCAGRSASVAVAVKLSVAPSLTLWLPMAASTGATLVSPTVIVIVSLSVSRPVPLSVTVMVTDGVRPPWVSLGVQLKAPVELLMLMPSASEAASSE